MKDRFTILWKQMGTDYQFVTDYWYCGPKVSGAPTAEEFMFNCCSFGRKEGFAPLEVKEGLFTDIESFKIG